MGNELMTYITDLSSAAAVVVVVVVFVKYLGKREGMHRTIADQCHDLQRRTLDVLQENSRALGKNAETMEEVKSCLQNLNGQGGKKR